MTSFSANLDHLPIISIGFFDSLITLAALSTSSFAAVVDRCPHRGTIVFLLIFFIEISIGILI